jgi:outer membrane murein-binding lipoprotein Lpp
MKRFLPLMLVAVALGLLLAGCSSSLKELTGVDRGSEDATGLSATGLGGNSELGQAELYLQPGG